MSKDNLLVSLENAGIYKSPKWLIRGVSLEVKSGQIVTLIGPNGCLLYTSDAADE